MKTFANAVIITGATIGLVVGGAVTAAQASVEPSVSTFPAASAAAVPVGLGVQAAGLSGSLEAVAGAPAGRLLSLSTKAVALTTQAIPYQYGGGHGTVPSPVGSRVDCSGLIRTMYYDAFKTDVGNGSGDSIVRLSGKFTKTSNPVVGDVALFGNGGYAPAYHAGIYIGNGPGGTPAIVAATQTGSNISVQEWGTRYWKGDLMGYWHYNGATAADSQTTKPAKKYTAKGNLEKTTNANGRIKVVGWAYDPAKPKASNRFALYVDGHKVYAGIASKNRPDIQRNLKIGAAHGINMTVKAKPGKHKISLVSSAASGSKTTKATVETHSVLVTVKTKGSVSIAKGGAKKIRVAGWTFDPQTPDAANRIVVKVDGKVKINSAAVKSRSDVARVYQVSKNHGFDRTLKASPGKHRVLVVAVGNKSTTVNTVLYDKVITVKS